MPGNEVPLSAAPERFFDQSRWTEVLGCYPDRAQAIDAISRSDPGLLRYYQQQAAATGSPRARFDDGLAHTREALVSEFKARLTAGELVATGIQPPSVTRGTIPAELWDTLQPDFVHSAASGAGFTFVAIRVAESEAASQRDDVIGECIAWLQARRQTHGEELKKGLWPLASSRFAARLTTRSFDLAYSAVYQRTRGRPRGTAEK
ncbi:MAG: hypothetical protein M0002_00955 [Rhodospirillales bacterium]|nr:hypothetical protein [Rhodospirillales bacterium]